MIVFDKMQQGYQYEYREAEGENFAPDFCPALTPKQMLELGVFEGHYMNDCQREFPRGPLPQVERDCNPRSVTCRAQGGYSTVG
jgi:hypothetical protein